jgi:PBP1b-binding outer membrane lipoprotein LpoB
MKTIYEIALIYFLIAGCKQKSYTSESSTIETDTTWLPREIIDLIPIKNNPVLTCSGTDTWDQMIREDKSSPILVYDVAKYRL